MRESRFWDLWVKPLICPRQRNEILTTCGLDDEAFAAIQYFSEVRDVGISRIEELGHANAEEVFLLFQSFIRQARTFYEAGRQLHYRASPLMYYYSFLNLAKAAICLSDPNFVSSPVYHGLTYHVEMSALSAQSVEVGPREGAFHRFYDLVTGRPIPFGCKLNITDLLAYCWDISYEYQLAGYGGTRLVPGAIRVVSNSREKTSWPILAVLGFEALAQRGRTSAHFNKYFERVETPKHGAREAFGILAEGLESYAFFESKDVYSWPDDDRVPVGQIGRDCYAALEILFESNLHVNEFDFLLAALLPLERPPGSKMARQIPFSQTLAIYVVMFYLGNLVRYHPAYLEGLLNSKDAWLIERFTGSVTTTFLTYATSLIRQEDLVYATY